MSSMSALELIDRYEHWCKELSSEYAHLIKEVVAGHRPLYLFGCNINAEHMLKHIPVAGVVDDYSEPGTSYLGLQIQPVDTLTEDSVVLNCVLHRRPLTAITRLTQTGATILHPGDFERAGAAPPVPWVEENRTHLLAYSNDYERCVNKLADDISVAVFNQVWFYRITGDPLSMTGQTLRDQEQYFDVDWPIGSSPTFVDGGAYEGETTEVFISRYQNYRRVLLFEPTCDSLIRAKHRLKNSTRIDFFENALGDKNTIAHFDDQSKNASSISDQGNVEVSVRRLDDCLAPDEPVDLIKFDLEGFEQYALDGAAATIERHTPCLAICVYHLADDFPVIMDWIQQRKGYKRFLLRHYTEGWEETVLCALPE